MIATLIRKVRFKPEPQPKPRSQSKAIEGVLLNPQNDPFIQALNTMMMRLLIQNTAARNQARSIRRKHEYR